MKHVCSMLLLVLIGCATAPEPSTPEDSAPTAQGVYVLNEGLWGQSNASLSLFDPLSRVVQQNVFAGANGRPLGDVANFITVYQQLAFIVLNGSDKIEVIETDTQKSRGTIVLPAGLSPRQFALVNDSVALVTNLYDASVSILSLRSYAEVSRLPVGANPEGIAIASGKAFVANSGLGSGHSVSMIDLSTLSPAGTLDVGDNPSDIVALDAFRVAVLCAGAYGDYQDPNDDTPAKLIIIDALQQTVVDSLLIGDHAFRMATDGNGIVYIPGANAVFRVDTRLPLSRETFVAGVFYGVGVDTVTGDVYVADARTFSIPGEVRIFSSAGVDKGRFDAGLIPGRFAFPRQ